MYPQSVLNKKKKKNKKKKSIANFCVFFFIVAKISVRDITWARFRNVLDNKIEKFAKNECEKCGSTNLRQST